MKKTTYILVGLIILLVLGYYFIKINNEKTNENLVNQFTTYSKAEYGLQFEHKVGPAGYVVQEMLPSEPRNNLEGTIILFRTEDYENLENTPVGGEGPPVIAMYVFENVKKQFPRAWADENIQYSNINLNFGDVNEAVVGGANAIRYKADGLYASENIVVAHGEKIYVLTGQYFEENSQIHLDFELLVNSIEFIPEPGQE